MIKETGLWHRANFSNTHFSRFGICFVTDDKTEQLFENASTYQPAYFPEGTTIDVLANADNPTPPWTFRLSFKGQKKNGTEPTEHQNGIRSLTKAIFDCEDVIDENFLGYFKYENSIEFKNSSRTWLTLFFDNEVKGQNFDFENLILSIRY